MNFCIADYIEKQSPYEFYLYVDKFGWGFPLLEDNWKKHNFNIFEILKHYPEEWKEHVARFTMSIGNSSDNYDILVSLNYIVRKIH